MNYIIQLTADSVPETSFSSNFNFAANDFIAIGTVLYQIDHRIFVLNQPSNIFLICHEVTKR